MKDFNHEAIIIFLEYLFHQKNSRRRIYQTHFLGRHICHGRQINVSIKQQFQQWPPSSESSP